MRAGYKGDHVMGAPVDDHVVDHCRRGFINGVGNARTGGRTHAHRAWHVIQKGAWSPCVHLANIAEHIQI